MTSTHPTGQLTGGGGMARRVYSAAVIVLVAALFVAAVAVNAAYTRRVAERSDHRQEQLRHQQDQRWCALLRDLDQPGVPAQTPRGQMLQQRVHQLRYDLGCIRA